MVNQSEQLVSGKTVTPRNKPLLNNYSDNCIKVTHTPDSSLRHQVIGSNHYKMEAIKQSAKKSGIVKAFSANTHKGLIRNYNEDRVSIVVNISDPRKSKPARAWPQCSFFGVYDGHGGTGCADFLRDNLHTAIINNEHFPARPDKAIEVGFSRTEQLFIQKCQTGRFDPSGSCAVIVLVVEDKAYIGNTGDSRALLSISKGAKLVQLTTDHKPEEPGEYARIIKHGGKTYQTQVPGVIPIKGPVRVFPGRLSVSPLL